jgi:hypothetical protein
VAVAVAAARGLAGVARPAIRFAAARVVAARRNHCSDACWTWPNWWRIISCSTGASWLESPIVSTK